MAKRDKSASAGARGSSTFTRTVWLPQVVDGSNVTANLEDGVLTLTIPKANNKERVKVSIT